MWLARNLKLEVTSYSRELYVLGGSTDLGGGGDDDDDDGEVEYSEVTPNQNKQTLI